MSLHLIAADAYAARFTNGAVLPVLAVAVGRDGAAHALVLAANGALVPAATMPGFVEVAPAVRSAPPAAPPRPRAPSRPTPEPDPGPPPPEEDPWEPKRREVRDLMREREGM
ncbi:MAG: hypothetical protein OJJ54_24965 [Pseudonocardia sp.]|nr:hypothetical protein [Pseudonocardia sp.]